MTFKTIICDDFSGARDVIKEYIKKLEIDEIEIIGEANNGLELIEMCRINTPDIIILDIEMPKLNGIETAKRLVQLFPNISIIFITAYDNFTMDAFEVYAIDYIVKPIMLERFEKTLRRVINKISAKEEKIAESNNELFVTNNHKKVSISQERIIFVERDGRKSFIHTLDGVIESYEPINFFEKQLNSKYFIRVHRSYLINRRFSFSIKKSVGRIYEIDFDVYKAPAYISRENLRNLELPK